MSLIILASINFPVSSSDIDIGSVYVGGFQPGNLTVERELDEQLCARGDAGGCYRLGVLLRAGNGGPVDKERANALFDKACRAGVPHSCYLAGNFKRARELYEQACATGDAHACHRVAYLFLLGGKGGPRDTERAAALFDKACRADVADACDQANPQRARQLYERACKSGDAHDCFILALSVQLGEGGPKDMKRARSLFDKACSAKVASSCAHLADLLRSGGAQDKAQARMYSDKACKLGLKQGCDKLRDMVSKGEGSLLTDTASAPPCHQEAMIAPSTRPCGKKWRPAGQWKAKYWCYTDFNYKDPLTGGGATFCTNGRGTWDAIQFVTGCIGEEGWCNN